MAETGTRGERKERTRRAILDAALALSEQGGLSALSLRQVAREVGVVPTAFYRHFASIDELGLTLVGESFASLRDVLREVRQGRPAPGEVIARSVQVLAEHVSERHAHFAFIARERAGGPSAVRTAVRHQLELVERELATDLTAYTGTRWSGEDLRALSNLIVNAMVATTESLLVTRGNGPAEAEVRERAEKQLRMVVVGALQWRSDFKE